VQLVQNRESEKIMDKLNKVISSICVCLLLMSNPTFASYHTDDASGNTESSDSGGGYGSGGSALALIAVYAVGYMIYKNTREDDEEGVYMFSKRTEPGFEVSLSTHGSGFNSYSDNDALAFKPAVSNPETTLNFYYRFK